MKFLHLLSLVVILSSVVVSLNLLTPDSSLQLVTRPGLNFSLSLPRSWQVISDSNPVQIVSPTTPVYQIDIFTHNSPSSLDAYLASIDTANLNQIPPQRLTSQVAGLPAVIETGSYDQHPYVSYYFKSSLTMVNIITFNDVFVTNPGSVISIMASLKLNPTFTFACPASAWVDCLPGPDQPPRPQCDAAFLTWAKANCPGFQDAAY